MMLGWGPGAWLGAGLLPGAGLTLRKGEAGTSSGISICQHIIE